MTLYGIVEASGSGNLRTDYHQLIAKAVEGLDRSTREARRVLYERARKALVAQMRSAQPALSKPDIVKGRPALEEAIRKVEAEAARKSPTETLAASPAAGAPDGGTQVVSRELLRDGADRPPADLPSAGRPPVFPDARERLLNGRSSLAKQAVKGFRDVIREVRALLPARRDGTALIRLRSTCRGRAGLCSPMTASDCCTAGLCWKNKGSRDFETLSTKGIILAW